MAHSSAGLRRTILATGYLSEKVEAAIGTDWNGMAVSYSIEDKPLGTGGAVALAARQLQGSGVHVANGDTYLRFDLRALERAVERTDAWLGMALAQVPDVGRYGMVEVVDGRARAFREKGGQGSGLINAGSYFLSAEGLAAFPSTEVFSLEEQVLLPLASLGRVAVMPETTDFIDIGVPEDYRRAQQLFGIQT